MWTHSVLWYKSLEFNGKTRSFEMKPSTKILLIAATVAFITALVTATIVVLLTAERFLALKLVEKETVTSASLVQPNDLYLGTILDKQLQNSDKAEEGASEAAVDSERTATERYVEKTYEADTSRTLKSKPWSNENYNRVSGLPVGYPKEYFLRNGTHFYPF